MQVVKRCLTAMLSEIGKYKNEWMECLPACLMGLRFLASRVTGYSPFTTCFGTVPRVPLREYDEWPHTDWDDVEFTTPDLTATIEFIHE